MSEVVIRVENLSKLYRIGERLRYQTLRDTIANIFTQSLRRVKKSAKEASPDSLWALKGVSFEVKTGEVVGIIGRNGAGKTTLLKILSRITSPTEGSAQVQGRVGSLLEIGTGFHPELTGRDNIYLNGAILGMRKKEIDRKFNEIVAFAEVERFIDTPIKHYSSGMHVRLAFAVAAHLEPEILLVDEVLAVGDTAFQKKCLGKMDDVAKKGRTVLFVSHNMGSLINLCPRTILLAQGEKWRDGPSDKVISEYIAMGQVDKGERSWNNLQEAPGNEKVRFRAVRITSHGQVTADVDIQKDVQVELEYWNLKPETRISTSIHLLDQMGVCVLASGNSHSANLIVDEWFGKEYPAGLYRSTCTIPGNFLNEGRYTINAFIISNGSQIEAGLNEVISFTVHETGGMRKEYAGQWIGVVRPRLAWQTCKIIE